MIREEARPMPDAAPVTIATFSFKLLMKLLE
jgi:hypothetical protein